MGEAVERDQPILVTGATGRHGGTGGHLTRELLAGGTLVRALVRSLDDRAARLIDLGADVVVGDFADVDGMAHALDGVRAAYFCHPVGPGLVEAAGLFAAVAKRTRLPWLVDVSLAAADARSPSPQGRAQWISEQLFEWAGIPGVHMRIEAFFMENLLAVHGEQIRRTGVIRNAFGDHPVGWMAGADVGAVAAKLLVDQTPRDRTVQMGPTVQSSFQQVADTIGEVTGRTIAFEDVSADRWREELVADAHARRIANPTAAAHLAAQAVRLRARPPVPVRDDVQRLTGRPATSLVKFVQANSAALSAPH